MKSYYKSLALVVALISTNHQVYSMDALGHAIYTMVDNYFFAPRRKKAEIERATTLTHAGGRSLNKMIFDDNTSKSTKDFIEETKATINAQQEGHDIAQNSLLLDGTGGVGKTSSVATIAKETKLPLVTVTASSLSGNGQVGQVEVTKVLTERYGSNPFIFFIDELDVVFDPTKNGGGNLQRGFVDTFKAMTGTPSSKMVLIAATNNPELLSPSMLRRFTHRISMPLPNDQTRAKVINLFKTEHGLDGSGTIGKLCEKTLAKVNQNSKVPWRKPSEWAKEWTPEFTQQVVQATQGLSQAEIIPFS